MNNYYLIFSSLLLFIPILIHIFKNILKKNNTRKQDIICLIILCNIIISCLFWYNPIKYSLIHKIDGIYAKISFCIILYYILLIKKSNIINKLKFLLILFFTIISFLYSNKFSSDVWLCYEHLICHLIFHIFISIGACFAFI